MVGCDGDSSSQQHDDAITGADAGGKTASDGGSKVDARAPSRGDASHENGATDKSAALPCAVQKILSDHCWTCHGASPIGGVPMSLASSADFQALAADGSSYTSHVSERVNQTDPKTRMPPVSYPQLSSDELAKLNSWLAAGAKGASETCTPSVSADAGVDAGGPPPKILDSDLTCYRMLSHGGDGTGQYQVGIATDSYVMAVFAAPWKETEYGIVIRPVIDNAKALHHWLLFQDDVGGIPGGPTPEVGAHPTGQLIAGWAPGNTPTDFRTSGADVGLELPSNTTYTVEFHYNSSDPFAADASGVEICTVKRKPANVAGISWLGLDQLVVPSAQWTGTCSPVSKEPIYITQVWPHMHLTGKHMKATINRKDGTKESLYDGDFDFNYQKGYPMNVTINPGDTITTVCDYTQPMSFGESTQAEMCYLFTTAYPKGALAGLDIWGSFAHGGSSCLGQ
ncbi:MAG: peptidylglycine alpha-amidating monooxygenase [Myxococcaceae bacterium]|nr:peptidylglycine alpha-amidating monooxygenase [Myxococcaceae bacterium]